VLLLALLLWRFVAGGWSGGSLGGWSRGLAVRSFGIVGQVDANRFALELAAVEVATGGFSELRVSHLNEAIPAAPPAIFLGGQA